MANTSYLSAGQAAKEAGVSKATISKALTSGRLSYVEKDASGYRIDPAELFRVYPRNGRPNGHAERSETRAETAGEPWQVRVLQAQLQAEREKTALLQENLEDLRREVRTLSLVAPTARLDDASVKPEGTPGLFGWLRTLRRKQ